jgi:hypothetical protein
VKWADIRDMFKKSSRRVCASIVAVSPDPDDLKTGGGWNNQIQYSSD